MISPGASFIKKPSRREFRRRSGGINFKSVISADTRGGNGTSRADQSDLFARNRGLVCVYPDSKKWLAAFSVVSPGAFLL